METILLILRRLIAPIFAVFFAAAIMNSAFAAGALYAGLQSDSEVVYFFANGYDSHANADNAARAACEAQALHRGSRCIDFSTTSCSGSQNGEPSVCMTAGIADGEAVAVYSNRIIHPGSILGWSIESTLGEAQNAALADCRMEHESATTQLTDSVICLRDFQGVDAGDSNPRIERVTVAYNPLPSESGGGGSSSTGLIIGGVVVVGGLAYLLSQGGEEGTLSFSPDFNYGITESGYSANVGGRMDFAVDNWRLYFTAGQENANGDFGELHYASGGEYRTDFWTAAFSESVQGEIADYDFTLSADVQNGIWNLSPTYRFNSRLDWKESESDSRNSLNIESVLRMNRWTIRPTAGFNWRRFDEFGDSARFGFLAVRRF